MGIRHSLRKRGPKVSKIQRDIQKKVKKNNFILTFN
jgi:hypothetical protein